jgi:tRNA pseudouridine13 synthase
MHSVDELPYLTATLPGIGGVLRASFDDFRVDEIPSYEPSGEGTHTYLRIEKRDLTTIFAIERIARALRVDPRDVGYAGLKDRHAVTTQWISVPNIAVADAEQLKVDGVAVLAVSRHTNKLRTGHLRGNRFSLRITGIDDVALASIRARDIATELQMKGCPNYFGAQRFGREGDNSAHARAWLKGDAPAPRAPFMRRMLVSALQSELFNDYLAQRMRDGLFHRYVAGDLAQRLPVGRPWLIDSTEAQSLYDLGEVGPTGPLFGLSMPQPVDEALLREEAVLRSADLTPQVFSRARGIAEGTRRPLRMNVGTVCVTHDTEALLLEFSLPAGGYATAVTREFIKRSNNVETDLKQWHPTEDGAEPS